MKKILPLFNVQTLVITVLSLVCSYISLIYHYAIYIDFLLIGLLIVFPLTLAIRVAFRRRERAIQYMSLFRASLQSIVYCMENSKLDGIAKMQFRSIAFRVSAELQEYLKSKAGNVEKLHEASNGIAGFIQSNRGSLKSNFSVKILLFFFRVNESIDFLVATKRHHTPVGLRVIVLFSIYTFTIFYPASLLQERGFNLDLWYLFAMSTFKSIILISLYNVRVLLEDPFNPKSPDRILVEDFHYLNAFSTTEAEAGSQAKKEKQDDDDE